MRLSRLDSLKIGFEARRRVVERTPRCMGWGLDVRSSVVDIAPLLSSRVDTIWVRARGKCFHL